MFSDPQADAYAKQQAEQARQDAEARRREKEANDRAVEEKERREKEQERAESLASRSQFNGTQFISHTAKGILDICYKVLFVILLLYGGHLAANDAIGYNAPFRILTFVYGSLCFWYQIPRAIYRVYVKKETLPNYTFLPLSTYTPNGDFERFFIGPFCYTKDAYSGNAQAEVKALYETIYKKSIL